MNSNLSYWLAALYLPNTGPRTFFNWLTQFPAIENLLNANDEELKSKGFSDVHCQILKTRNEKQVEKDLAWALQEHQHIICFEDENYPALLKQIPDPPLVLFVKGCKQVLLQPQIAIVGSRRATYAGAKNAEQFAYALAKEGYAVTSGLAMGIDGASHKGALAANGITIGVAGTGLHHVYPRQHHALINNILEKNGAVVSEFPLGLGPLPANFPRRNRIISGLSLGVLVVEAALKSGSLITARQALEQGREVFAVPGSIHNQMANGCHYLIRQGAKLVETVDDIFEELGRFKKAEYQKNPAAPDPLPPDHQTLLSQIDHEITPLDVILCRSRLTAGEVSSILLILELKGYIQSIPGGYVRIQ